LTVPAAGQPPVETREPAPGSTPRGRQIPRETANEDDSPGAYRIATNPAPSRSHPPPASKKSSGRAQDDPQVEEKSARAARPGGQNAEADRVKRSRRRQRAQLAAWRKVLAGLCLIVISMGLTVLTLIAGFIAGLLGGERVLSIFHLAGFVWQVLALVGYALCLAVPAKHHARTFALATLILAAAGLLFDLGSTLVAQQQAQAVLMEPRENPDLDESASEEPPVSTAVEILSGVKTLLVDYGRLFAFLFFLRAVALMYEGNDLIRDANRLLVLEGAAFAWWALDGLLSLIGARGALVAIAALVGLGFLCGLAGGLLNLAILVLFLRLLANTLMVLQRKAAGEPFYTEEDRDAVHYLPVDRRTELA